MTSSRVRQRATAGYSLELRTSELLHLAACFLLLLNNLGRLLTAWYSPKYNVPLNTTNYVPHKALLKSSPCTIICHVLAEKEGWDLFSDESKTLKS